MTIEDSLSRLTAGLDRDEAIARAADATRWLPEDKGVTFEHNDTRSDYEGRVTADTKANMNHIAEFGPRRVLRQVEVFQRVLKLHAEAERDSALSDRDAGFEAGVYATIELLAGIYTDETEKS